MNQLWKHYAGPLHSRPFPLEAEEAGEDRTIPFRGQDQMHFSAGKVEENSGSVPDSPHLLLSAVPTQASGARAVGG